MFIWFIYLKGFLYERKKNLNLIFFVKEILLVFGLYLFKFFFLIFFFASKKNTKEKINSFERGFNSLGKINYRYRIHFFFLILIFVFFDLELIFLFILIFRRTQWFFLFILVFFFIFLGLILE